MSSKAARLGTGASFAQTRTVSARRQAIEAATKAPTEGAPPPVKLPVEMVSLNPANPRSELGDLTELAGSLRDHGQKQAITIMSRFAYLEANPGMAEGLEKGTRYVAIDGNSRLAAAREAGLSDIKVTLDEDLGSSPDEVLESALVSNIHRQDLDPLDEARALEQLLKVHGSQRRLAARLHRSQGWVSQRLALLGLTPELQAKLASGEESAELLRSVGNKKPEEQEEALANLKAEKQTRARGAKQPSVAAPDTGEPFTSAQNSDSKSREGDYGVITEAPVAHPRRGDYGVITEAPVNSPRSAPEAEQPSADLSKEIRIPSADPAVIVEVLMGRLSHGDVATVARLLEESLNTSTSVTASPAQA
ncbi:ParB/RepB/Spo0J family partition protein [Streptomyces sp. TRM70308]|uniref:ParB/RepB/Spo0J family partition protein n=1 Tax=Streptomyces sp. TRM70308 TaxID=3131932 RepID=UPI003D0614CA